MESTSYRLLSECGPTPSDGQMREYEEMKSVISQS